MSAIVRFLSSSIKKAYCASISDAVMDSMFIVKDESIQEQGTFYHDELLPALPLPYLEHTLAKYLDSCRPVLNEAEYKRTDSIVQSFLLNDGNRLHEQLLQRSKEHKNWLDDWWLDGYLYYRGPAAALNFTGFSDFAYWPPIDQVKSSALQLHLMMRFWQILREERLRQQMDAKGNKFSMFQYKFLFNTCRIPLLEKDNLSAGFKTKYEGHCPSHIIIIYKRNLYKIPGLSQKTGQILSPGQFHKLLLEITKNNNPGPGVACLTELPRDEWAAARAHLLNISPRNRELLKEIETAAFCACITDKSTPGYRDKMQHGMFETAGLRWADKLNIICNKENDFIIHSDHTPLDGMVVVTLMSYCDAYLRMLKSAGLGSIWGDDLAPGGKATELSFEIDDGIRKWISDGGRVVNEIGDSSEVECLHFTEFGKKGLRKLTKIHPCAFVQVCLQYAYMKMHGRPASTYETATTRIFYKGRTETNRTCTVESVQFCNAMIADDPGKKELFTAACQKYLAQMDECRLARGCDRHLLGLSVVAMKNGEETPGIFTDPAFAKSGGGGNFLLSTSFLGYATAIGGVLPFRDDGYGVFYRINNDKMTFVITASRKASGTSALAMKNHLHDALVECYNLHETSHL